MHSHACRHPHSTYNYIMHALKLIISAPLLHPLAFGLRSAATVLPLFGCSPVPRLLPHALRTGSARAPHGFRVRQPVLNLDLHSSSPPFPARSQTANRLDQRKKCMFLISTVNWYSHRLAPEPLVCSSQRAHIIW